MKTTGSKTVTDEASLCAGRLIVKAQRTVTSDGVHFISIRFVDNLGTKLVDLELSNTELQSPIESAQALAALLLTIAEVDMTL